MPRTIEHLIACHEAAVALRAANKPIWGKSIDIKAILQKDPLNETPEHIASISVQIA